MTKNVTLFLLSILITTGYLVDVFFVMSGRVNTTDPNQLLMIGQAIGGLQGMAMMVASYYFGTTKGSEEKNSALTDTIAKIPAAAQTTVSATVTSPTEKEKT